MPFTNRKRAFDVVTERNARISSYRTNPHPIKQMDVAPKNRSMLKWWRIMNPNGVSVVVMAFIELLIAITHDKIPFLHWWLYWQGSPVCHRIRETFLCQHWIQRLFSVEHRVSDAYSCKEKYCMRVTSVGAFFLNEPSCLIERSYILTWQLQSFLLCCWKGNVALQNVLKLWCFALIDWIMAEKHPSEAKQVCGFKAECGSKVSRCAGQWVNSEVNASPSSLCSDTTVMSLH